MASGVRPCVAAGVRGPLGQEVYARPSKVEGLFARTLAIRFASGPLMAEDVPQVRPRQVGTNYDCRPLLLRENAAYRNDRSIRIRRLRGNHLSPAGRNPPDSDGDPTGTDMMAAGGGEMNIFRWRATERETTEGGLRIS